METQNKQNHKKSLQWKSCCPKIQSEAILQSIESDINLANSIDMYVGRMSNKCKMKLKVNCGRQVAFILCKSNTVCLVHLTVWVAQCHVLRWMAIFDK